MKKQLNENDMQLAHEKFEGRASPYAMRIAEYLVNRLEMSIPKNYKPLILDDGRVVIEMEYSGMIEIRLHGAERYSTLIWLGGKGELSLVKRLIQANIVDTIGFINTILKSLNAAQATGNYVSRSDEKDAQDADMEYVDEPEESSFEYFKSEAEATGMPSDHVRNANLYDLSSMTIKDKEESPSAGAELQQHMNNHDEEPDKKKMETAGNLTLAEGVKYTKFGGKVMITDSHGKVQLVEGNVQQKKKVWGWQNGRTALYEIVSKL